MINCRKCAALIREECRFCPECGEALVKQQSDGTEYVPQGKDITHETEYGDKRVMTLREQQQSNQVIPQPASVQDWQNVMGNRPAAEMNCSAATQGQNSAYPASNHSFAVLSTWSYLWSFLLLSLPVAGLVIAIVWASGGAHNQNRRHMGRAYLLLAGAVMLLMLGIAIGALLQLNSWGGWYY